MDTADIIHRIVMTDDSAIELIDNARAELEGLDRELAEKQRAMREDYFKRADAHIRSVELGEAEYAEEQIRLLDTKLEQDIAASESAFTRNESAWVEALFREIIGS